MLGERELGVGGTRGGASSQTVDAQDKNAYGDSHYVVGFLGSMVPYVVGLN